MLARLRVFMGAGTSAHERVLLPAVFFFFGGVLVRKNGRKGANCCEPNSIYYAANTGSISVFSPATVSL